MMSNTTYQLSSSLGGSYSIDPNGLTIGRARTNTIAINDPLVSRLHARLLFAEGRYWIRDEKSHAGILVNGHPVSGQQEFKPGDILQIGSITFWLTSAAQTASQLHSPVARTKRTNLVYVGIAGVLLVILMIAIGSGGGMSNSSIQSQTLSIATNDATLTEMNLETLPPPLANVKFPEDVKPYPADWPADLHFPESFKSIDFSQGTLPGGNKLGRSLKIRFNGTIQDAADGLRAFLSEKGWKIVDETDSDTGGKLWIIEKDGGGTGMIVIDAQGSDKIVIIATFYV